MNGGWAGRWTGSGAGCGPRRATDGARAGRDRRTRGTAPQPARRRFDLLAVEPALALVGSAWRTFPSSGRPELAARQGAIAVGGVLALAVCWRFRVRYLRVLGWAAYGAAVVFLVGVLTVGLSANGATGGSRSARYLPALGAGQARAAAGPGRGPRLHLWPGSASAGRAARGRADRAHPAAAGPQHRHAAPPSSPGHLVIGRVPGSCCRDRGGGGRRAAADQPAAALPGGAPGQLPGRCARVADRVRLGTAAGGHRLGSGGLFGRTDAHAGLRAQYLPERDNRLAPASLVGQWGLVAGAGVVLAGIVWCGVRAGQPDVPDAARRARRGGLAVLLGVEIVVSVGANLGLLPLAGVPVPLLSYGGTALVVHLGRDRRRPRPSAATAPRDGSGAPPRGRNPRPRLVPAAALGLSVLLISFGFYE